MLIYFLCTLLTSLLLARYLVYFLFSHAFNTLHSTEQHIDASNDQRHAQLKARIHTVLKSWHFQQIL